MYDVKVDTGKFTIFTMTFVLVLTGMEDIIKIIILYVCMTKQNIREERKKEREKERERACRNP